ncbi:MAG: non-ribosomal peptide synthetase [Opitutaceae bacterium]
MASDFVSLIEQIGARAAEAPDTVAVGCRQGILSYADLDRRSAELARRLRGMGAGPGSVVGVCLPRSPALAVAALGTMKAGGAYLPLDPADPELRLASIVSDAAVPIVIALRGHSRPAMPGLRRLAVDRFGRVEAEVPGARSASDAERTAPFEPFRAAAQDLAYVITTSGSTGRPKGVEVTHGGLSNLVRWHLDAFHVDASDRASQIARVAFDAAVWESWPYLAAGASLHLPEDEALADPEGLRDWLLEERITIGFAPTLLAERLIGLAWPKDTVLRTLLTGADTLRRRPPAGLPFALINNYGPTEFTVVATSGAVAPDGADSGLPPIGWPIANTEAHVLDANLRPVPRGEIGELCLAGPGVARGYRNLPEATAERFVRNPFGSGEFGRLLRTGDRVRRRPDGQLEFIGRMDEQIKIRGFRVEPREIEAALQAHPAIRRSLVVARSGDQEALRLVAYLELQPQAQLGLREAREFLEARLPAFMIPEAFVVLPELPVNGNGKVDRGRLPAPGPGNALGGETADLPPRTATERIVAGLIAQLLGLGRVGVSANFFELGGHSLLAAQVIARIRDRLDVELPLRTVFESPTVDELAAEVDRLLLTRLDAMGGQEASCAVPA